MQLSSFKTLLYVPANQPRMLEKSRSLACDAVIFDLEDAVPEDQKDEARRQLQTFLSTPFQKPFLIRINGMGTRDYEADLRTTCSLQPLALVLPKTNAESVFYTSTFLDKESQKPIGILPLVESALAVETVLSLLDASPRNLGAQLGAEDLTAELGISRTTSGEELRYARHRVVYGCRARGLPAFDSPYLHFQDETGLRSDSLAARSIGFTGKACIHPNQIGVVNQAFAPTPEELEAARALLKAAEEAKGGAFSYQGQMIDAPVIERARQLLDRE